MTVIEGATTESLDINAQAWLSAFEHSLTARDPDGLRALFADVSYWRDQLAFTRDIQQFHAPDDTVAELMEQAERVNARNFAIDPERRSPLEDELVGAPVVEFHFTFETMLGPARGYVISKKEDSAAGLRAFVLYTFLKEIRGGEPRSLEQRHPGLGFEPAYPGQTWGEYRAAQLEFADREPEVLVVGGGQAGSTIAAHLVQHDIDALVVDKHENPGDSWRKRYESLALHTPTDMSDFPYFPFPKTFPTYLPKDKYADYLEAYIRLMDLNYWTSTSFEGAEFDAATESWVARVNRDGVERVLHPKHIIVTVGGAGGKPNLPDIPGLKDFAGKVIHSSQFRSGADHEGTRSMVVGVGTSGHDIALDLYHHGGTVEMLQRGSISVVDVETANVAYGEYFRPEVPQPEADVKTNAKFIEPLLADALRKYTQWTEQADHELHVGLEKAGMQLDIGEDGTGWQMKFARYAGGYYLNVGASDVIIDGGIAITQYDDFDRFVPEGVRMKDGSVRPLDVVILATGYENLGQEVRRFFGEEVAERVGNVGGIGPDGERRNFCRQTAQPNLWFMFGGVIEGRRSAPSMIKSIKAHLMGLLPTMVRGDDLRLKPYKPEID